MMQGIEQPSMRCLQSFSLKTAKVKNYALFVAVFRCIRLCAYCLEATTKTK